MEVLFTFQTLSGKVLELFKVLPGLELIAKAFSGFSWGLQPVTKYQFTCTIYLSSSIGQHFYLMGPIWAPEKFWEIKETLKAGPYVYLKHVIF